MRGLTRRMNRFQAVITTNKRREGKNSFMRVWCFQKPSGNLSAGVTKESQMIQDKIVNQEQGFTMLEIVTVLVLLGIISAVAVPKYFDMQGEAEKKAAKAALAEAQVRINAGYSKAVYAGKSCEDAVARVNKIELIAEKVGDSYAIGQFEFTKNVTISSQTGTEVQIRPIGGTNDYSGTLTVPSCESESGSSSGESGIVCPDSSSTPNLCLGSFATKCNGTVTCVCTETGMSCTCASGSVTPSEDEDEIVKPGSDAIKLMKPFDWDADYDKYGWLGLSLGSLILCDGKFYVVTGLGTAWQSGDFVADIEKSSNFINNKIIKLDLSRENRAQYDSENSSKPWKVWSESLNSWNDVTAIKSGSVVYYNGSVYIARNSIVGNNEPKDGGINVWGDWIRVTNFDIWGSRLKD